MKLPLFIAVLAPILASAQLPINRGRGPGTLPPGMPAPYRYPGQPVVEVGPLLEASDLRVYRTISSGTYQHLNAEIPSTNAMLIGFEISTNQSAPGRDVIASLQPIYFSEGRRVTGRLIGEVRSTRTQIVAREGYAVREVKAAEGNGGLTGLQVVFGRVLPDGTLSMTDGLMSAAVEGATRTLQAEGLPFCGISANNGPISGLVLLVSRPLVSARKPALLPQQSVVVAPLTPGAAMFAPPTPPNGLPALPPGVSLAPSALPSSTTPAPVAPTITSSVSDAQMGDIVRTSANSLVLVEGNQGQGSAFLCSLNGKAYLLTNQHVVQGNPRLAFTTLNQANIHVGPARAAAAHDLLAYEVDASLPTLQTVQNLSQEVSVGDDVVVLGNTEGARVIKPLSGKVVGLGPNLVEISSEFMPGNSGSPIIHVKTGKVIGIATYALVRKVNSLTGEQQPSVRRFGYRLDSVQSWQPVNWATYQAEAAAVKKAADSSGAIINLLLDLRTDRFKAGSHGDSRLKPALRALEGLFRNGINQGDRTSIVQNFLGEIRNVVQRDVDDLRRRLQYDYFQRELAEETKLRAEIYEGLGKVMDRLR